MKAIVTGMGMINALANNVADAWEALLLNRSAIEAYSHLADEGYVNSYAALCGAAFGPKDRGAQLAAGAIREALGDRDISGKRVGLFLGSTLGESYAYENAAAMGHETSEGKGSLQKTVDNISCLLGIDFAGVQLFANACAAGNYALEAGAKAVEMGYVDLAIAGGVDPFSHIAFTGFQRSRAMSPSGECRPFDQRRNGMILGEGAAFIMLEPQDGYGIPGQQIRVGSLGLSCDAYHPTAPAKDGSGMEQSIRQALELQQWNHEEVDMVCIHGSGTALSDLAEGSAICRVFGEVPVAGCKGAWGHSLGAATAMEAIVCIKAMQEKLIPPTPGFQHVDQAVGVVPYNIPHQASLKKVINTGFAFGGLNSCLCLEKI